MTTLSIALRGLAMGLAEVVPGVSGGTIAFITGIYERLILAIKSFDADLLSMIFKGKFRPAFHHVDGLFLLKLLAGMVVGIVVSVLTITWLLDHYPPVVWAFFFGLIVASAIYVFRQIDQWKGLLFVFAIIAAVLSWLVVGAIPTEGSSAFPYIFLCGAIAMCALILPGISGSFILLILGMYQTIIGSVKDLLSTFSPDSMIILGVFLLGGCGGLAVFSRILSWTFKHYKDQTLAVLTGLMIGSLRKIWPWRNPTMWMNEDGTIEHGNGFEALADDEHIRILLEQNVWPNAYEGETSLLVASILSAMAGFAIVFVADRIAGK